MTCLNSRDTLTQADGLVLPNNVDFSDVGFNHTVTSFCRTTDGTWLAWINEIAGDSFDNSLGTTPALEIKASWPSEIASSYAISVGFFPDDGSGPIIYHLGVDPFYGWTGLPAIGALAPCGIYPLLGDRYADVGKARLTSWGMDVLDVQIRTDGTNVWVVALARESVKYPWLYNSPTEIDACGVGHPTFEEDWAAGHSDPFFHDYDSGNRWWVYFGSGSSGRFGPFDDTGDPGHIWGGAFRWQPPRVTVWGGDIGGFTMLDTVEAKFGGGLVSGVEAAASPAEPGVLHVMWSEGGYFGPQHSNPQRGQRINYSRWDPAGKTLDTDLRYFTETDDRTLPTGYVSDGGWVWTAELILRNDHGSPIAIAWPWETDDGPIYPGAAEFWDLSAGTADVLQVLDPSLYPTPGEIARPAPIQTAGSLVLGRRSQFASSIYADPTLDGQNVYLLCVAFYSPSTELDPGGTRAAVAFYRIPCDGSAGFDYLDGTRKVDYSITSLPREFQFGADFVSDTDNVWMPYLIGGDVWQLTRKCGRTWSLLPAFPTSGAWDILGNQEKNGVSPPILVSDGSGDWLAGGGYGPSTIVEGEGVFLEIAALRAKICRCCVPCAALGLHAWHRLS